MKALILVGGYGTRLRPLTLTVPKPLVHFCNRSILEHQVEALVKVGVDHIILAVAYKPEAMQQALKELETKFHIRISCSLEHEPLGTAGPIQLAKELLLDSTPTTPPDLDASFFVLNSDVICNFPLQEMLDFHHRSGGEGTILVTTVEDPSNFGVVVSDEHGRIERFVGMCGVELHVQFLEKPKHYVGNSINAGVYVLKNRAIDRIPLKPTSIEREIFPAMAADNVLYCFGLTGYWVDIGQPREFLIGMRFYLESLVPRQVTTPPPESDLLLATGDHIRGNVLIHPTARIGSGCLLGPNVTIGRNCVLGDGVRLTDAALLEEVTVASHSYIASTIIGSQSRIGDWVRIEGLSVFGEDVHISKEIFINQAFILPHKAITAGVYEPGKIIL